MQSRRVARFEIAMGGLVMMWWLFALTTDQVPEVGEGRAIWFHLAAEASMAALLLTGGGLLIRGRTPSGVGVSALGLGAAFYSLVNAAGYYADRGEPILTGTFLAVAAVTGLVALGLLEPQISKTPSENERRRFDADAEVGG